MQDSIEFNSPKLFFCNYRFLQQFCIVQETQHKYVKVSLVNKDIFQSCCNCFSKSDWKTLPSIPILLGFPNKFQQDPRLSCVFPIKNMNPNTSNLILLVKSVVVFAYIYLPV